jgi:DNA-binding MarR family transcriptional regulator
MSRRASSSPFTHSASGESPGPPLIGALLRRPYEVVQSRMLERLHDAGFDDLEPAHLNLLRYPGPQGLRPSDLASQVRMSKQAVNYLLGQLERLGYLERQLDPDDQRFRRIALTARGAAVVPVIRDAVAEVEGAWARLLGPDRFDELRALLAELNERL